MKNILSKVFIFSILLLVLSCDKWDYSYPFVKTVSVENFNDTSAVLKGKIVYLGDEKIIDYGYVQDYNGYTFYSSENIKNEEGTFEVNINEGLRKGYTIRVAAYAKTIDETVMGEFISYKSTENIELEIVSITPVSGDVNTVRTMVVKNYSDAYGYYIYIGGSAYHEKVTFIPPNTFEIKLNPALKPGNYSVKFSNLGSAEYPGGIIVTE